MELLGCRLEEYISSGSLAWPPAVGSFQMWDYLNDIEGGNAPAAAARGGASADDHGNVARQTEQVGLHR